MKGELSRLVDAKYATGDQWRNYFRKNEAAGPKWKDTQLVDVSGDESKV